MLTLFDLHPQTLVQNNFALLQLQRRFVHPVEHEHEMISWQALVSLGVAEVCYQRSSFTLMFQDLGDEALSSELVSIQFP